MLGASGAGVETVALTSSASDEAAKIKEEKLEMALLGQPVSERTRSTVLQQFQNQAMQQQAVKDFSIRPNDFEPTGAGVESGQTATAASGSAGS